LVSCSITLTRWRAERSKAVHDTQRPAAAKISAAPAAARLPVLAIVGRPNAGKSTLFNRLVGGQRAVVDAAPGVTRDRNVAATVYRDRHLIVVDTGGLDEDMRDPVGLLAAVSRQTLKASQEADAIVVLLDGRAGFTELDRMLVARLRKLAKPVFLAVNKLDTPGLDGEAVDFFRLGMERIYPISAAHGRGVEDLMADVIAVLPTAAETLPVCPPIATPIALAIVGRPNVGKSSLLNRLVGEERAIVSAMPGTTRDAVDSTAIFDGRPYVLIDTAGIRRRFKVHEALERASVARALRALDRAEVALLILDATRDVADQDARIANHAWERGRALLLVVNKWDVRSRAERDAARFRRTIAQRYPTLAQVPVVFVSALTGKGVGEIVPAVERVTAAHRAQLQTSRVNQVLADAVAGQAPASVHGRRPVFYYATQTGAAPPVVTIFSSAPALVQPAYERYLRNQFAAAFELWGTPLRVRFRARPSGPRVSKVAARSSRRR
jgi:GTPase